MMARTKQKQDGTRELLAAMAPFGVSSPLRSAWQLVSTLCAYLAANAAVYALVPWSRWAALAPALVAGLLLVRLFIVQHDCGHGAFFRSRRLNDLVGRCCGMFTFTPYHYWKRLHAYHHSAFNNLDRRDAGPDPYSSCATLTEYRALSPGRQRLYRLGHHPVVTQLVLPPLMFLLMYRFPFNAVRRKPERNSVLLTNGALVAVLAGLGWVFGAGTVALVQLPIMAVGAVVGAWLFSVQHRFEESMWARGEDWSLVGASLEGSSFLALPRVLQWFTGNIGYHHVHHLLVRVPNYRLQECHQARPELHRVKTLTLRQALRAPFFVLWDEEHGRMVPFPG